MNTWGKRYLPTELVFPGTVVDLEVEHLHVGDIEGTGPTIPFLTPITGDVATFNSLVVGNVAGPGPGPIGFGTPIQIPSILVDELHASTGGEIAVFDDVKVDDTKVVYLNTIKPTSGLFLTLDPIHTTNLSSPDILTDRITSSLPQIQILKPIEVNEVKTDYLHQNMSSTLIVGEYNKATSIRANILSRDLELQPSNSIVVTSVPRTWNIMVKLDTFGIFPKSISRPAGLFDINAWCAEFTATINSPFLSFPPWYIEVAFNGSFVEWIITDPVNNWVEIPGQSTNPDWTIVGNWNPATVTTELGQPNTVLVPYTFLTSPTFDQSPIYNRLYNFPPTVGKFNDVMFRGLGNEVIWRPISFSSNLFSSAQDGLTAGSSELSVDTLGSGSPFFGGNSLVPGNVINFVVRGLCDPSSYGRIIITLYGGPDGTTLLYYIKLGGLFRTIFSNSDAWEFELKMKIVQGGATGNSTTKFLPKMMWTSSVDGFGFFEATSTETSTVLDTTMENFLLLTVFAENPAEVLTVESCIIHGI
jgi:hypothetical protein